MASYARASGFVVAVTLVTVAVGILAFGGVARSESGEIPDAQRVHVGPPEPVAVWLADSSGAALDLAALQPLNLASADFDADGMPDVASAYRSAGGGTIVLQRGNSDLLFPDTAEARARRAAGAFDTTYFSAQARAFALPIAPDFLAAGDFDGDGANDLVAASRSGTSLVLLPGDGQGGFGAARLVDVPGAITALTSGEINRMDGLEDIAIGIDAPDGARVLIFESPNGALNAAPEAFDMPAAVMDVALGQLDAAAAFDLAVASGNQLLIIHGRDRRLTMSAEQRAKVAAAVVSQVALDAPIEALAVGDFVGQAFAGDEVAVLTADGVIRLFDPGAEQVVVQQAMTGGVGGAAIDPGTGGTRHSMLVTARLSSLPTDDLILIDASSNSVRLVGTSRQDAPRTNVRTELWSVALDGDGASGATSGGAGAPAAVLPMRLNKDALHDLVVLRQGQPSMWVIPTQPAALLVVSSPADNINLCDTNPGNGVCDPGAWNADHTTCEPAAGVCTLRVALEEANAHAGADEIAFGWFSPAIQPVSALPQINDPLTVDGSTNGASDRTELDGRNAGAGVDGLFFHTHDSVARGLVVNNFRADGAVDGFGIALDGNDNIVEGNYLGTNRDGNQAAGNGNGGVVIGTGTAHNTVGGTISTTRNLISGNDGHGIQVGEPGGGASQNVIQGNYIGLSANGAYAVPNWEVGVIIAQPGGINNLVGGDPTGRNVVAGNWGTGIQIQEGASANLVSANYVGVDPAGANDIANSDAGIVIYNASDNTIGYTRASDRNIVAGNDNAQIHITYQPTTTAQADAGTGPAGIATAGPALLRRITTDAGHAVPIASPQAGSPGELNIVEGNYVGVKVSGINGARMQAAGVVIHNASNNTVGGFVAGAANLVSRNTAGVVIYASAGVTQTGNAVAGNLIGTDPTGRKTDEDDVLLNGNEWGNIIAGVIIENSADNVVGGTDDAARNTLSGNLGYGVQITGMRSTGNQVQRNHIGTGSDGQKLAAGIGWGLAGVWIEGGSQNLIGGTDATSNTIAYGLGRGIVVAGGVRNDLRRNRIFENRGMPIDLGDDGVTVNDPGDPDVGANLLQNTPIISGVLGAQVTGTLNSISHTTYNLELYAYEVCKPMPGGHLADTFVLSHTAKTDANGNVSFTVALPAALPPGYFVSATATDPNGNTSEFSNPPIKLRTSSSAFMPGEVFTPGHTVLLYTTVDPYVMDALESCIDELDFLIVANGDVNRPIPMSDFGLGTQMWEDADFDALDRHYSAWYTPTQATTVTLELYLAENGDMRNAVMVDLLKLSAQPKPELVVLTDFAALFSEFNLTVKDSAVADVNSNRIRDYYEAVERIRQYAADNKGTVVDVRRNAYGPANPLYPNDAQRLHMPARIDEMMSHVPTATMKYVAIIGDDAVVPFYRYPDPRPADGECRYFQSITCTNPLHHNVITVQDTQRPFIMTDVPYSTHASTITRTPDVDWGLGRIFGRAPLTLTAIISGYEQPVKVGPLLGSAFTYNIKNELNADGTIRFNWRENTRALVDLVKARGYITETSSSLDRGKPFRWRWWEATHDTNWQPTNVAFDMDIPARGGRLTVLNSHANHLLNTTPVVTGFTRINIEYLDPFPGSIFVDIGCHAGYSTNYDAVGVNAGDPNYYNDALVRALLERQITYHASTTFGWTTTTADMRYNDRVHYQFIDALLNGTATLGEARLKAQQTYYDHHGKAAFNATDETAIYGTELYGLPTQRILRAPGAVKAAALGPVRQPDSPAASGVITFSLRADSFSATTDTLGRVRFDVPNGAQMTGEGTGPDVPVLVRTVDLPAGATGVNVTLIASDTAPYLAAVQLQPHRLGNRTFGAAEIPFAGTQPYPAAPFWFNTTGDANGARLTVSAIPLQWNPTTGVVTLARRMDFQVNYTVPDTGYSLSEMAVGQGNTVAVNQSTVPITLVLTTAEVQPLVLRWEIADAGGGTLRSGAEELTPTVGANLITWQTDSSGWTPGPMALRASVSDAAGRVLATGQASFDATGYRVTLAMDQGMYGPGEAQARVQAVVRDASGAEVSGLSGSFAQTLDGNPIALTWQEGGSYSAQFDLSGLAGGAHELNVVAAGQAATSVSFGIDRTPPTSTAQAPQTALAPVFKVALNGLDDGSGLAIFDVEYRVGEGGVWTRWLTRTTEWNYAEGAAADVSPAFGPDQPVRVTEGITYYFRARAVDGVGNIEAVHATADSWIAYRPGLRSYVPIVVHSSGEQSANRYVQRFGADIGACATPASACQTIQYAVDQAYAGDVIAIAGYAQAYTLERPNGSIALTYWETSRRPRPDGYYGPDEVEQAVYLDKSVTLRGGYSADFTTRDPATYKTVLRPGQFGFRGRVVLALPFTSPTLEGLYILDGDASGQGGDYGSDGAGGGIYAQGISYGRDTITIRDCIIAGNIGSRYGAWSRGGGVYLDARHDATLSRNAIYSNTAAGEYVQMLGEGGGVYVRYSDDVRIVENDIHDNTGAWSSPAQGGGLTLYAVRNARIQDNRIYRNVSTRTGTSAIGGGIYLNRASSAVVSGNAITSNVANQDGNIGSGGGLSVYQSRNALINRNLIVDNVAAPVSSTAETSGGGGVRLSTDSVDIVVVNNVIARNLAPYGGGGILLIDTSSGMAVSATLLHNTIADNGVPVTPTAYVAGGIVDVDVDVDGTRQISATESAEVYNLPGIPRAPDIQPQQAVTLEREAQGIQVIGYVTLRGVNNIVSGHTRGLLTAYSGQIDATMDHTLWYGNAVDCDPGVVCANNLYGDPAYVNPALANYHIGVASAARDTGALSGVADDIDGQARPWGSGYDPGADEYTGGLDQR